MKALKYIGLFIFLGAFGLFTSTIFLGGYELSNEDYQKVKAEKNWASELFINRMESEIVGKKFGSMHAFGGAIITALKESNQAHVEKEEWDQRVFDNGPELAIQLGRLATDSPVSNNKGLFFFLTFGLCVIGALMYILPDVSLLGPPGIKNNGIYHNPATSRGWLGYTALVWFVGFYLLLYFNPHYIINWIMIVDPVKGLFVEGAEASRWFLYGFIYTVVMVVMGIRMYIKYRHNKYQIVRTTSVLLFQIIFAFLLVEILPLFGLPGKDLKNAWPLDYYFLFNWNVQDLISSGHIGKFMFVWFIVLAVIIVPLFTYFYGKRWYCSWVCGCGGLAETLGDPYRQLSNKSTKAWKLERWLIHGVLLFAVIMTSWTGYHTYNEINNPDMQSPDMLLGLSAFNVREWYGLLIGSWFAGVIGTGFYPIFGNRVWCRFGCPLAAYMGLVQRFKSRFRITANGGQCISCGNCSTYCEQGIDVRWYAQRGQNIIRASCVGCGVCAAVCPRGVLKLENGPEEGRINSNPILIGNDSITLDV